MPTSNAKEALVAVIVILVAAAIIVVGVFYVLSNLVTTSQSVPPPLVSAARNWAGYVAASDLQNPAAVVVGVSGSWIVPTVTASGSGSDGFSAVWVGIGGQFDNTLIQTGTEQDYVGGSTVYYAWYEMLPNDSIAIDSMNISPGDQMAGSINLMDQNSNLWLISLTDLTTGESFQQNFTYTSQRLTAEWIVERPSINNQISTLANFGSVTFTNCQASLSNTGSISGFAHSKVIMEAQTRSGQSVTLADVSDLTSKGAQFTVTYLTG